VERLLSTQTADRRTDTAVKRSPTRRRGLLFDACFAPCQVSTTRHTRQRHHWSSYGGGAATTLQGIFGASSFDPAPATQQTLSSCTITKQDNTPLKRTPTRHHTHTYRASFSSALLLLVQGEGPLSGRARRGRQESSPSTVGRRVCAAAATTTPTSFHLHDRTKRTTPLRSFDFTASSSSSSTT